MALTGKKRLFANAVLAGKSNKDAAIAAGYSSATASAAGSRLVKDAEVAEYIKKHKKAKDAGEAPPDDRPSFDLNQAMAHKDPRVFLMAAMNDVALDPRLRIDAAKALMPFEFAKKGEGGKKDARQEAAEKAATGKFGLRAVK
ncbi:terminase small subunit [Comamonas odontotermitis]|uniref:terminase small subunit n=1 Tax=Comamonas odontotermitis TaxID=379895 RepID=UPI001CC3E5D9|nr:terminase small subunit [Comamonas odontotermitis]UBB16145.1 terminase small subunit [Comamonas odontotermitis]